MELAILGPLSIVTVQGRHPVKGEKGRAALALLGINAGRPVSSEQLVDELWPDEPVGNAKNALQAHITRLRKLLDAYRGTPGGSSLIETVGNGYQLDLPEEALDSNRFRRLAAGGTAALGDGDPHRAMALLDEALRLWHGPALIDVGDGRACRSAACWLDESRLIAHEDFIAARLMAGGERAVVPDLEELTTRYPLRERFGDLLMLALYRCGRQVEALDVYHRIRHSLTTDMGLDPGMGLQRRYRAILSQDPALDTSVAA